MTTFIVNLEMKLVSFVIVSLVFSSALTAAAKHHFTVDKTVFDALLQRLGTLEAKDNEKQEKIQLLEQEVLKMKKASEEDRKEIDRLKREVKQQNDLCKKVLGHMETDIKKVHLYSDLTDYREPQALDYDEAEVKFGATRTNANERQPKIKRHADQGKTSYSHRKHDLILLYCCTDDARIIFSDNMLSFVFHTCASNKFYPIFREKI